MTPLRLVQTKGRAQPETRRRSLARVTETTACPCRANAAKSAATEPLSHCSSLTRRAGVEGVDVNRPPSCSLSGYEAASSEYRFAIKNGALISSFCTTKAFADGIWNAATRPKPHRSGQSTVS